MKYFDKNGFEWSIEKGDWEGSFNKEEKSFVKDRLVKLSLPILLLIILCIILLK